MMKGDVRNVNVYDVMNFVRLILIDQMLAVRSFTGENMSGDLSENGIFMFISIRRKWSGMSGFEWREE